MAYASQRVKTKSVSRTIRQRSMENLVAGARSDSFTKRGIDRERGSPPALALSTVMSFEMLNEGHNALLTAPASVAVL